MKQKDPLAVELGRRGGLKGGPARARALSARRLSEIARHAYRCTRRARMILARKQAARRKSLTP